jgi:predicted phosphodiesterase
MQIKHIKIDNTPVYLIGDLHTNYKQFKEQFENDESLKNCIFIFLGDMDFRDEEIAYNQFKKLDNILAERNIDSYVIRGNHDNPKFWNPDELATSSNDMLLWSKFKSFKPIGSHTRITINGNVGIIISGAVTLNRADLTSGVNYWPEYDKIDLPPDFIDYGEGLKNIDFIIGHTGPIYSDIFKEQKTGCERYLKDGFLVNDLENEQKQLREILKRYRPKRWYCGHYHFEKDIKYVWDNWTDDGVIYLKIVPKQKIIRIA